MSVQIINARCSLENLQNTYGIRQMIQNGKQYDK